MSEYLSDSSREILEADRAIKTVAQRAIHMAAADGGTCPMWEDYPEIGENDWFAVLEEVDKIAAAPDGYEAAYAFLTARADHDA